MPSFHSQKREHVLSALKSSKNGLSAGEASRRLLEHGANELPKEKSLGAFYIFFNQFKNPLIYILVSAGVISIFLKDYVDAGVIFGACFINTFIGFFQENKANKTLNKLKELVKHKAIVLRGGQETEIDSGLLTLGDIIVIKSGNRVPADGRILEEDDLAVNEASLTGESFPVEKTKRRLGERSVLGDRRNMVYAGTVAVKGSARAVVTALGARTEIGKIAQMVKETEDEETPLQKKISNFSSFLGAVIALISIFIIAVGLFQGRGFFEMFITGVAVAVAAIPEGLIVALTVIMVMGMQQILKRRALVRKLVAAETLGSTTVICSDKTGTLTEGNMQVSHIIIGENEYEVETMGSRQEEAEAKIVSLALQAAMMCNDAVLENPEDELSRWRIIGAPTEKALLTAAIDSGLNKGKLLSTEPRIMTLPFNSENKYMVSLHQRKEGYVLYEKGAPEKIFPKIEYFYHQGEKHLVGPEKIEKLEKICESLTSRGLRVIAVAIREIRDLKEFSLEFLPEKHFTMDDWGKIDNHLVLLGLIALKDPLRPEAKETVALCQSAGIRPVIITGDHKLTAAAIAKEIGLKSGSGAIMTGEELDETTDEELEAEVGKINVYARVNPGHKLRIVRALQKNGEVVAMTGDGINDSPALKAADIGISLGGGTDIAKESSDLVLLDNNFKTIVEAVKQGRIIYANIRKVATYLLSDSFSEMIMIAGSILFGTPLAILPAQILWINIVNDGLPNFSLAMEGDDGRTMKRRPEKRGGKFLDKEMKILIFGVGFLRDFLIFFFFLYLFKSGQDIAYLRSFFFAVLGAKSLFAIFSLRNFYVPFWRINFFSNKFLLFAGGLNVILLLLAVYWAPLQTVLKTVDLAAKDWVLVAAIGVFGVILTEIAKFSFYQKNKALYDAE